MMATKKTNETRKVINAEETGDFDASPAQKQRSSIEVDDEMIREGADVNIGGGKKLGGPTGGDFEGGGRGPALGARHAADDSTADHYGSREETNAALEERIAIQNTRRLHGHY
jgi:hypothetical protein